MPRTKTKQAKPAKRRGLNGRKAAPEEKKAEKKKVDPAAAELAQLKKIFDEVATPEDAQGLKYVDVECPHCGEEFEIAVDATQGHELIQDCSSCCKSVTFSVEVSDGELNVSAYG
ncbi:MAG: CPXCG motif-containing cysteine-rich protein [Elusimicrobiota bacterium]